MCWYPERAGVDEARRLFNLPPAVPPSNESRWAEPYDRTPCRESWQRRSEMHRGGGGRTMHIAQRPGLPEKWCRRDAQCGRTPAGSPTLLSHKQSSLHSPPLTTSSIFLTAAGPSAVDHLFFVPQKDLSWSIKCTRLSQSKNTRTFPIDGCRRFVIVFSGLLIRLTQENVASGVSSHCWRAFSIRVHKGGTIPPKETHLRAHGSKDRTFRLWVWSQIAEMFFLPEMTAWKKKKKRCPLRARKIDRDFLVRYEKANIPIFTG